MKIHQQHREIKKNLISTNISANENNATRSGDLVMNLKISEEEDWNCILSKKNGLFRDLNQRSNDSDARSLLYEMSYTAH